MQYFSTCKGSDEVYQRRAPQHECWVVQGSLSSHHRTPGPGVSVRRYIYLLYLSVDISICYTSQICRYFSEMSRLLKYRSCKTRCQMSTFKQLVLLKHTFSSNMKYNSLFADDTNTYSRVRPAWTRLHAGPTQLYE